MWVYVVLRIPNSRYEYPEVLRVYENRKEAQGFLTWKRDNAYRQQIPGIYRLVQKKVH